MLPPLSTANFTPIELQALLTAYYLRSAIGSYLTPSPALEEALGSLYNRKYIVFLNAEDTVEISDNYFNDDFKLPRTPRPRCSLVWATTAKGSALVTYLQNAPEPKRVTSWSVE